MEASSEKGAEVWEVGVSNGESYFKPPNPPSQMSQFTRCRICFSYYENDVVIYEKTSLVFRVVFGESRTLSPMGSQSLIYLLK